MILAISIATLVGVLAIAGLLILHVVRTTEVNVRWTATFFVAGEDGEGDFQSMTGTANNEAQARDGIMDALGEARNEHAGTALIAWLVAPDIP